MEPAWQRASGTIAFVILAFVNVAAAVAEPLSPDELVRERKSGLEIEKAVGSVLYLAWSDPQAAIDLLEDWARRYRQDKVRLQDGRWALAKFYEQFWWLDRTVAEQWLRAYPYSATAHIASAIAALKGASGGQLAAIYGPRHRQHFAPNLEEVRKVFDRLLSEKAIASQDPHWYVKMIEAGTILHIDVEDMLELMYEGLDREPTYATIMDVAGPYFLPRWYGSADMFETFAQTVVRKTGSTTGASAYAQVYLVAYRLEYGSSLFGRSSVDWQRFKLGIEDSVTRFRSPQQIGEFTVIACLAGDRVMTRQLYELAGILDGGNFQPSEASYHVCRPWAFSEELRAAPRRGRR